MLITRLAASVDAFIATWVSRVEFADWDEPHGAEWLCEKEAEEEVSEGTSLRVGLEQFARGERVSSDWLFENEEPYDDDPMVSDSYLRYNEHPVVGGGHTKQFGPRPRIATLKPPVSSLADVRETSEVDAGAEALASPDTGAGVIPTPAPASTCKHCGQPIEQHDESEFWMHVVGNRLWRIACEPTYATPK